jgi:uncharacterized delta-60 repeat protein
MKVTVQCLFLFAFGLMHTSQLFAQAGHLDSSFNGKGYVQVNNASDMKLQVDGKLILAGAGFVSRYNTNGSPDSSFGINGVDSILISTNASVDLIAIQPDDKIVVEGSALLSPGNNPVLFVARRLAGGQPDNSFNNIGYIILPLLPDSVRFNDIALSNNGKIILAGHRNGNVGPNAFAVSRLNADGSIDNTFGEGGIVYTTFAESCMANSVAVQTDGKIIAAGTSSANYLGFNADSLAMIRYNIDGSPDNTFNANGKLTFSPVGYQGFGENGAQGKSVLLQPDGKIIVAGIYGYNQSHGVWVYSDVALSRFNTNGTLDNTFNGTGTLTITGLPPASQVIKAALQCDGKIVIGGNTASNFICCSPFISMWRAESNGATDSSFGSGGNVTLQLRDSFNNILNTQAYSMQVSSKRIYFAGSIISGGGPYVFAFKNDNCSRGLPPDILSFTGKLSNSKALLNWKTENEINITGFTVERSSDGRKFISIAKHKPYNTGAEHKYTYRDAIETVPAATVYYRIRQTDAGGDIKYSNIIALTRDNNNQISLYTNPVGNILNVLATLTKSSDINVRIFNSIGRVVKSLRRKFMAGTTTFEIDIFNLQTGIYFLKVNDASTNTVLKFVKL